MKMNAESMIKRYEVENLENWSDWVHKIPALKFDADWEVTVIPPFCGAVVRFWVEANGNKASVYLDCFDALGFYGEPYWEVFSCCEESGPCLGNVGRCAMNETDTLLNMIRHTLEETE